MADMNGQASKMILLKNCDVIELTASERLIISRSRHSSKFVNWIFVELKRQCDWLWGDKAWNSEYETAIRLPRISIDTIMAIVTETKRKGTVLYEDPELNQKFDNLIGFYNFVLEHERYTFHATPLFTAYDEVVRCTAKALMEAVEGFACGGKVEGVRIEHEVMPKIRQIANNPDFILDLMNRIDDLLTNKEPQ